MKYPGMDSFLYFQKEIACLTCASRQGIQVPGMRITMDLLPAAGYYFSVYFIE
jgi:hypothetical protein